MGCFDIVEFGAPVDGASNAAGAIQKAIDAAAANGGGTVVVPAGKTFVSGTIALKKNVQLHMEAGSRILGSLNPEDYRNWLLVEAFDADGIGISGTGTIDGRGGMFKNSDAGHIYRMPNVRPRLVGFFGCRGVRFRDVTLKDSANWGLHMTACEDVVIDGISILNDLKLPNCDGIDPDHCRNVRISNCHIEAGDDCIVFKATKGKMPGAMAKYESGPCENITVTGCTMVSTSCAVKLGTETHADIRNITVTGCVIRNSARGLGLFLRDSGNLENVLFSDCIVETRLFHDDWWGKAEPIYVTAFPREKGKPIGVIRNVRFSNIVCRGESGAFISGSPASLPEDVVLDNVRIEIDKTSKHQGGLYDRRPGVAGIIAHPTAGVYLQHAVRPLLRNVEVVWGKNRPAYFGHALEAHGVAGLRVENFAGEAAHGHLPARVQDETIPVAEEMKAMRD